MSLHLRAQAKADGAGRTPRRRRAWRSASMVWLAALGAGLAEPGLAQNTSQKNMGGAPLVMIMKGRRPATANAVWTGPGPPPVQPAASAARAFPQPAQPNAQGGAARPPVLHARPNDALPNRSAN